MNIVIKTVIKMALHLSFISAQRRLRNTKYVLHCIERDGGVISLVASRAKIGNLIWGVMPNDAVCINAGQSIMSNKEKYIVAHYGIPRHSDF